MMLFSDLKPLQILDKHVQVVLFSCSGYEARNYGKDFF